MRPLRIDIITLFPEVCAPYLAASILGRAQRPIAARRLAPLRMYVHNLRDWTHDRHKKVDEKPFGGGPGMVMTVAPFHEALMGLKLRTTAGKKTATAKKSRVILTSAKGKLFTQADARRLGRYHRLIFLCGRYEGVDDRVAVRLADEEISIGPYVLTGGELPALVMADAIARVRPGVLGKHASLVEESWNVEPCRAMPVREYPQYTRPESYLGWKVPPVLLSGNHQKIAEWRRRHRAT